MRAKFFAALLLLFLPSLAHAQAWSSVQLVTSADNAQQLILRSADGSAPRRIRVDNLVGNPITNATLSGSTLTITFRNGTTRNLDLPSGGGGGGGGLTTDQARDTAGALVATLPTFTYDAAANTLAWANNSIPAAYAQTSSATTLRAWRSRLGVADDWSEIPNGTAISSGKVVEHGGGYYGAITSHTKSSTGPDGDATNWIILSNFRGAWSNAWWPAGTIMTRGGLPWVATSAVVLNDPAPDASNNTKWLALGSLPPSVVIASSDTTIPASADGNTYVHTGSSNITYTLPQASGGSAVDNGWQVVISNQGAGDLTIDGNGSDTVDGAATLVITTNGRAVRVQKIANSAWATIADTKDETGTGGGLNQAAARIAAIEGSLNRRDVFGTLSVTPPGIPGRVFPEFLAVTVANKLDARNLAEIRVSLNGIPIGAVTDTGLAPFNGLATVNGEQVGGTGGEEGGVINLVINAVNRANLANNITTQPQWVTLELAYKFEGTALDTGTPADQIDRVGFAVNNAALRGLRLPPGGTGGQVLTKSGTLDGVAVWATAGATNLRATAGTAATPATGDRFFFSDEGESGDPLRYVLLDNLASAVAPTVVLVEDASAINLAAAANTETTILTARITPRSATTRIRVDVVTDTHTTVDQAGRDARLELRLYRGSTRIANQLAGNTHAPNQDQWYFPVAMLDIDDPASAAEQTYTVRAVKFHNNVTGRALNRRIVLTEVR